MPAALETHDRTITDAVRTAGGIAVKPRGEGDSHFDVERPQLPNPGVVREH